MVIRFISKTLLLFSISVFIHAQTLSNFERALADFKTGNYTRAAKQFESIIQQSPNNAAALYNLGVCYYKSFQFPLARDVYLKLQKHQNYQAIAIYNLGLVSFKLNDKRAAINYFTRLSQLENANQQLKTLALKQIEILSTVKSQETTVSRNQQNIKSTTAPVISTSFMINSGFDDKILDPNGVSGAVPGDHFYDVYAALKMRLTGEKKQGLFLRANIFEKNYQDIDAYDFSVTTGMLEYQLPVDKWQYRFRYVFSDSTLDIKPYQTVSRIDLRAQHRRNKNQRLSFRYRYDDITSQDLSFDAYAGQRQKLYAQIDIRKHKHNFIVGLELEFNDRADREVDNSGTLYYTSYSATRTKLHTAWSYRFLPELKLRLNLGYRTSEYNDLNTLDNLVRQEDRVSSGIRVDWKLHRNVNVNLHYRYSENTSNIPLYEYTRNVTAAGVSAFF